MNVLRNKNFNIITLLMLLFIAPSILALWFYYHPSLLPKTTINKGRLLQPPIILTPYQQRHNQSQLTLVLWYPQQCTLECKHSIAKLFKIRLALGRSFYNVDQLIITQTIEKFSSKYLHYWQQKSVYFINSNLYGNLYQRFNLPCIFIMNKNNHLILSFTLQSNAKNIYTDLRHLI